MIKLILTGTIAAALVAPGLRAADNTSDAARLRKLEDAVSQLQQENVALKDELHSQESSSFANSSAAKIKMSDSITEMKLYGEARLRYFINEGAAAGLDAGDHAQRDRLRYRLRLGADFKLKDNWSFGVLLETGSVARSANVTLGENPVFSKTTIGTTSVLNGATAATGPVVTGIDPKTGKVVSGRAVTGVSTTKGTVASSVNFGDALFVGRVFLKYQPWDWLTVTGGKIANPFVSTRMVWDPDLNPEGFAEQFKITLGGGAAGPDGKTDGKTEATPQGMTFDLFANFGQFVYNDVGFENSFNAGTGPFSGVPDATDRWMLGWQIGARANFTKDTYFQVAPALYTYTGGGTTSAGPFNGDNALVILNDKADPTLITFNQTGTNDLAVLDIPVELGWKVGDLPMSIFGDFAVNLDGDTRAAQAGHPDKSENIAYQIGASVGQTKHKGDWELRGWYQHSEAYALDQNIIDDDIFDGRLNMEGFFVQGTYLLSDSAAFIVQYGHGSRIDNDLGTPGFGGLGTPAGFPLQSTNLVYIDLNLKF